MSYRHLAELYKMLIDADSEQSRYFMACCRIRGISPAKLMTRLMQHIVNDHLVESILDDYDSKRDDRTPKKNRERV